MYQYNVESTRMSRTNPTAMPQLSPACEAYPLIVPSHVWNIAFLCRNALLCIASTRQRESRICTVFTMNTYDVIACRMRTHSVIAEPSIPPWATCCPASSSIMIQKSDETQARQRDSPRKPAKQMPMSPTSPSSPERVRRSCRNNTEFLAATIRITMRCRIE